MMFMNTRRKFLKSTAQGILGLSLANTGIAAAARNLLPAQSNKPDSIPKVISTWQHGLAANDAAWEILSKKGRALDAVEQGVRVPEGDPNIKSVGYGGLPDRDGFVTLDACIMDENGNCGSVAFLQDIMHPISVARLVMEKTEHVMLVGEGALKFALDNGFKKENLLTPKAKESWENWLKTSGYTPLKDYHDTIGMLAIDSYGNLSGACTTSGLPWKMHGRVGDSPIVGAGMYADNKVGAACATGVGETVIKICGSFLIVELMRNGYPPLEACKEAIKRIAAGNKNSREFQVGFLAMNKSGVTGAFSLNKDFSYAMADETGNKMYTSESYYQ
jgi:L-asparaginase/N4-(beta-N-acetylglucosaminyl)-L-asparaginase